MSDCWICRTKVAFHIDPLTTSDNFPTLCEDCFGRRVFRRAVYQRFLRRHNAENG